MCLQVVLARESGGAELALELWALRRTTGWRAATGAGRPLTAVIIGRHDGGDLERAGSAYGAGTRGGVNKGRRLLVYEG